MYGFAKENKITIPVYYQSKRDKAVTPKFYGILKIQKSDVLLRPIVTYCLALLLLISYLLFSDIFNWYSFPLLSLEYTVQNSSQLVPLINDFQCFSDECLVTFDVVS